MDQKRSGEVVRVLVDAGADVTTDGPMQYADDETLSPLTAPSEADDKLVDLASHGSMPSRLNRRNSISLPAGLDLEHMSLSQEMPQRDSDTDTSDNYTEGEGASEEEEITLKVPLRARRKSVMPPKIKINDDELLDVNVQDNSPHNSITSINSIASLLKEKLSMSFPAMLKSKRPQEYKLKAFVGILFLCIVFLVGFAHIYYHEHVLQRAYFDNIRLNKEERVVRIFNDDLVEVLYGNIGTSLGHHDEVYHCLPQDEANDGSICMEWMNMARLYLDFKEHNSLKYGRVRCYNINWISLDENVHPTDCYDWSESSGHWYGGGQTPEMAWPIDQGTVQMSPFITGDIKHHQWGNVLSRYFINSKGVAITIDPTSPLHISINERNSSNLCLRAKYDSFGFANHPQPTPHLNYSICTSNNMQHLHEHLSEKNLWDGLKKEDLEAVNALVTEPIWQIPLGANEKLTEAAIYNYTEDVISLGFLRQGHVLLSENWQTQIGDFSLDPYRFPTMEETINIIHRRGFRLILTVQPYISTESASFPETVRNDLLIKERDSQHNVPALVQYKDMPTAGLLDITNNRSISWLQVKLKALIDRYSIDSFFVDVGTAYDIPHCYRLRNKLTNPDYYKKQFTDAVLNGAIASQKSVVGVSSAIVRPRATIFVSLPPFSSSWASIKTVIPTILTYGVSGYPFVLPGSVGGDYQDTDEDVSANKTSQSEVPSSGGLPDKELYIRWLQLASFLPVIRFTHLPSKYGDESLLETAKFFTALRLKIVNPLLKKYVRDALDSGLPIIRPLWMLDPTDPACHMVSDEFSVGSELLVAPIIYPGSNAREIYLPAGVWKDGVDGSLRKGSRWLHSYKVAFNRIPHFIKMPDNTRF